MQTLELKNKSFKISTGANIWDIKLYSQLNKQMIMFGTSQGIVIGILDNLQIVETEEKYLNGLSVTSIVQID